MDDPVSPDTDNKQFTPMPRAIKIALRTSLLAFAVISVAVWINDFRRQLVSKADQMEFVRSLEKFVADNDSDAFASSIDWDRIADAATAGISSPSAENSKNAYKSQIGDQHSRRRYADGIINAVNDGGSFTFLRLSTFERQPVAVFRVIKGGRTLNYLQFFVSRSKDGIVRASDIHSFLVGERISEQFRRIWQGSAEGPDERRQRDQATTLLMQLVEEKRFARVLEEHEKLPKTVQQEKAILLCVAIASLAVTPDQNTKLVDEYRKQFPNDLHILYLLWGFYHEKKEYLKAVNCIDQIINQLGADGWLHSCRAFSFAESGDFEKSYEASDEAIRVEPQLFEAYSQAIESSIRAKNHDSAVKYLTRLDEALGVSPEDLTDTEFLQSPQYAKWLESRH